MGPPGIGADNARWSVRLVPLMTSEGAAGSIKYSGNSISTRPFSAMEMVLAHG